jgi:hypothetical protein
MLEADVKIIRQVEDHRVNSTTGAIEKDIRVEFKVGDDGPFTERIPKDTFTADLRDELLERRATEFRRR